MAFKDYLLGGGLGGLAIEDYNRKTTADTLKFDPTQFNRERDQATSAVLGSAGHNARGATAQLEQQGLGGVPGITMAANNQARQTSLNSLKDLFSDIGSREERQMQLTNMINEARKKEAEEKDAARRARWGQAIKTLTALGVTLATAGAGAPLMAASGAGTVAGAGVDAAMPAKTQFRAPEFGGLQIPEFNIEELLRKRNTRAPTGYTGAVSMGGF